MPFGLGRRDSVKDAMVQHNLLNLDQMTVKATAILMFKQNAGLKPSAFNHLFLAKSYRYRVGTTRVSDSIRVGLESHFLVTRTRLESLSFFSEMTRLELLF